MFAKDPEKSGLETTIDKLISEMLDTEPISEDYATMADQLVKLYALKEVDSKRRVSPDVWATIAANILGIVLVTRYERVHVITSKVKDFVLKLR